jgi:hypothetical protein
MAENIYREAPASWNVKYKTAAGYDAMLTLRGETGKELLDKAEAVLTWLQQHECSPLPSWNSKANNGHHNGNNNGNGKAEVTSEPKAEDVCPVHNATMRKYTKGDQCWFSHKLADGSWCNGKAK